MKERTIATRPHQRHRRMRGVDAAAERLRARLQELSRNIWWSWNPEARELWTRVWESLPARRRDGDLLRNPVLLLRRLERRELEALASDASFRQLASGVFKKLRSSLRRTASPSGMAARKPVAYFSMEFGVHESLPVYAGGLGVLAGDHLKSASDEGIPMLGVGLFYRKGYFRQELDGRGRQKILYPRLRPDDLPVEPVRAASGRELRIPVPLPGRTVKLKAWRVDVGRVPLYLLDSDLPENRPADRRITHRLYGGMREDRIRQEVLAGIGGVRLLAALGIKPGLWHLNEGHVAFLTLERIREFHKRRGLSIPDALEAVRSETVFTTHTPVPEGNETFDLDLARRYLAPCARAAGIQLDEYLSLGIHPDGSGKSVLSMTVLAIRLSRRRNGVSRLHAEVSRGMWSSLWPGRKPEKAPIVAVTNGVHTATWAAPALQEIFSRYVGPDWERSLDAGGRWRRLLEVPPRELYEVKRKLKGELIDWVRRREEARLAREGVGERQRRKQVEELLDPDILTLGFARRFAAYKRAPLLFHDIKRALRLFSSRSRPLQIIYAGKPHPEDTAGRLLFEKIAALSRRKGFRGRVVLLENYDVDVCRRMVSGVDIWLNNPRRPQEASGTSGQKVPINAGLNVSILDGWWCEGYSPETGWAFGKPTDYTDKALQDAEDARGLYRVLERDVLPLYYRRSAAGIPLEWFRMVRRSMALLIPRFSTAHMVREYTRRIYVPTLREGKGR